MFFRETKVTEEDIRRMFHQVREKMKHMITLTEKSDPGKFAIPCVRKVINSVDYGKELGFIGACHCGAEYESEYETEYSESIDTPTFPSIDSNESTVTDDRKNTSLDVKQPVDHFTPPNHCYPHFAFQPTSKRGHDNYSIGSWADSGFHESFAVDTVITSSNEEHTEEYDEDYWKERAIEMSLQDERFETHKFKNTFPTSIAKVRSTSVDTHPRLAKQPLTSIDTHSGTSIDIRAAGKIQDQENIPSPTRFIDTYINHFAPPKPPQHTRADTQENKMNTLPSTSTGKSMKSNHLKHTSCAEITMPSIDASVSTSIDTTLHPNLSISEMNDNANIDYGFLTPDEFGIFRDPDGNARAMDGRILQVSREDIADILQVANGPDNQFLQQRGTPDVIQTDPNNHVGVATTEINPDLLRQPKEQASIDGTTETSIDRVTPTSIDRDDPTSIDRRYEFGNRAFDMYGARKFTWERRDDHKIYKAHDLGSPSIDVQSAESINQHGTPDVIQTDPNNHVGVATTEINPDLSRQPKGQASIDGTTETSIDRVAPTSIDRDDLTSIDRRYEFGNRAFDMYGTKKFTWERRDEYGVYRDECGHARGVAGKMIPVTKDDIRKLLERTSLFEESHICLPEHATSFTLTRMAPELYTKDEINGMVFGICGAQERLGEELKSLVEDTHQPLDRGYNELFKNLDTIRKKDQQPATSIDVCTFTSLDTKVSAINERLRTYEDMHDRFISRANSASIDRLRGPWIDGKNPVELLPYTAAEVDKITSKIYTAIDNMEERLDKRCDDIYFPFDNKISGLDSHTEWLQKEVKAIQRQLAAQHQISASINRMRAKSLDGKSPRSTNEHIIASIDAESTPAGEQMIHKTIVSMHKEMTELSAYAYDNIGWHQFSIDNIQDRLQNISNQREKDATTSASIDAPHAPSIDVSLPTAQIPAEPQCSAQHKDEWEVSYIDTRINDVYYPLNNNVDGLSTKIELLQQDLDPIRKKDQQPATSIDVCTFISLDAKAKSASIDRLRGPWIDGKNPVELLPYTAAEVDKITSKIYTAIDTMEHQISASIDRTRAKSLDGKSPRSTDEHIIASIDAESTPASEQLIHKTIESMHKEMTELSAYAYDNIGWHQVIIDNIQDRLQNISTVLEKMDDKWKRNDEATRNSTIDAKADQPINYTLALKRMKQPKLISNTKPDITTCLEAWYTWDRILQTSL
ncbi:hypothetical protein DY000_02048000 [Brassica cretica]|uniref:Uncharacterized protein n=1 Tax=Brassica cretica TaxID=69181 RepID=A0ABQ7F2L3_BRACR|nr:hypothetical protein DY000_02048000 [Brassica cretica]